MSLTNITGEVATLSDGRAVPTLVIHDGACQFRMMFDVDRANDLAQALGTIITNTAAAAAQANSKPVLFVPDVGTIRKVNGG